MIFNDTGAEYGIRRRVYIYSTATSVYTSLDIPKHITLVLNYPQASCSCLVVSAASQSQFLMPSTYNYKQNGGENT